MWFLLTTIEPIIPNIHYAAVTVSDGTDHVGRPNNPKNAAKEILERYRQVRDDHDFVKNIAINARKRMTTVATPNHVIKRILRECWDIGILTILNNWSKTIRDVSYIRRNYAITSTDPAFQYVWSVG
jgi:hypothetical protein